MRESSGAPRTAVRLHKFIAQAGLASRRTAERWILQGRVCVNGVVITALGTTVDPDRDEIHVDGRKVEAVRSHEILLLHKPRFCVTTVCDPQGRPTVMDYLHGISGRVYPVGRLDWDATGALLLTNDGELANRLMHPAYGIPKTYRVRVRGVPSGEQLAALRRGVRLTEGITAPAEVRLVRQAQASAWLEITLHQGWYRQIKRMGDALGLPVLNIHRTAYGPIRLDSLPVGRWRHLTEREVRRLREAVSLPKEAKARP